MADQLEIVNRALSRLGEPAITSLDEDSRDARTASLHYEATAREILRSVPWTCAKRRSTLVLADPQPDDAAGYSAAWSVPTGTLLLLELASGEEWIAEAGLLFTDDEAPILLNVWRAPESAWDDLLASSIELRLASKLALEVTSKPDLSASLFKEASLILSDARRTSLFESHAAPSGGQLWTDSL